MRSSSVPASADSPSRALWRSHASGVCSYSNGTLKWAASRTHLPGLVVLMVLQSNTRLHEHKAAGRTSVQAITGHIRMHVQDEVIDLPAGHMLASERALPHDLEALEN